MSERGLVLALQRLHDDPGFIDMVAADSESTLGIYDLDETECQALIKAVTNKDEDAIQELASKVGVTWADDHIEGLGALAPSNTQVEGNPRATGSTPGELSVSPFGADWITGPAQSHDSSPDLSKDQTGLPIKPAGS